MDLTKKQERMLEILKNDSCGPTFECLKQKFGREWLRVSKQLIELGLARVDEGKNGRPDRVKPTKAFWDLVE